MCQESFAAGILQQNHAGRMAGAVGKGITNLGAALMGGVIVFAAGAESLSARRKRPGRPGISADPAPSAGKFLVFGNPASRAGFDRP